MRTGLDALGARRAPVGGFLVMLVVVDVALIVFYILQSVIGVPGGFVFDLGADRGYGEFFQYVKFIWIAMLLMLLAVRRRAPLFVAWALVSTYFFIDDAFQVHERTGGAVGSLIEGQPWWAPHAGELVFAAVLGAVVITVLGIGHMRSDREDRAVSTMLALLFGALVFFGVVVDAIHHLLAGPGMMLPLTVIEDGGEMLALSLVITLTFAVTLCGHRPNLTGALSRLSGTRHAESSRP